MAGFNKTTSKMTLEKAAAIPEAKNIDIRHLSPILRSALNTNDKVYICIGDDRILAVPKPLLKITSTNFDHIFEDGEIKLPQGTDNEGLVRLVDHLRVVVMSPNTEAPRMDYNLSMPVAFSVLEASKLLGMVRQNEIPDPDIFNEYLGQNPILAKAIEEMNNKHTTWLRNEEVRARRAALKKDIAAKQATTRAKHAAAAIAKDKKYWAARKAEDALLAASTNATVAGPISKRKFTRRVVNNQANQAGYPSLAWLDLSVKKDSLA